MISWRAAHGLSDRRTDYAALTRAIRCHAAAWVDWRSTVAHLVVAGRATCGRDGDLWAREQLRRWVDTIDDAAMNELADALEAEDDAVSRRLFRSGSPQIGALTTRASARPPVRCSVAVTEAPGHAR